MEVAHYSQVGLAFPGYFNYFWLGCMAVCLAGSLWRKRRFSCLVSAATFGFLFLTRMPSPYAIGLLFLSVCLTRMIDVSRELPRRPSKIRSEAMTWGGLTILVFLSQAAIFTDHDLVVYPDSVVSGRRFHASQSALRTELREEDFTDNYGDIFRHEFESKTAKGSHDFDASTDDAQLYWDHAGHILSGDQVARRLEAWANIRPFRRSPYRAEFVTSR